MKQRASRRKFTAEFKAKVALEAVREQLTLAELSKKHEVAPVMISRWKSEFLKNAAAAFDGGDAASKEPAEDVEKLYAQIGKLKVENDFLKKVSARLGI
jgi:transposase-like protein